MNSIRYTCGWSEKYTLNFNRKSNWRYDHLGHQVISDRIRLNWNVKKSCLDPTHFIRTVSTDRRLLPWISYSFVKSNEFLEQLSSCANEHINNASTRSRIFCLMPILAYCCGRSLYHNLKKYKYSSFISFNISHVEICLGLKLTIKTEWILSHNNGICGVHFTLIKRANFRESCTLRNQKLGKILLTLHIFSFKFKYFISLGLI